MSGEDRARGILKGYIEDSDLEKEKGNIRDAHKAASTAVNQVHSAELAKVKRISFGWQYWARVFGYDAEQLLVRDSAVRWVEQQLSEDAEMSSCHSKPNPGCFVTLRTGLSTSLVTFVVIGYRSLTQLTLTRTGSCSRLWLRTCQVLWRCRWLLRQTFVR